MRILFLNYEYPPLGGGAANATKCLLEEYAKMPNVEVDLVTSAVGDTDSEERIGKNVRIFRVPIGKNPETLKKQSYKDLLRYTWEALHFCRVRIQKEKVRYDLVHAFFSVPCGFMAMLFRYQFKLPYIVSLRGADVPGYSERFVKIYGLLQPLIALIWSRAQAVISNSEGLKKLALKTNKQQEIRVIYNGVDTHFFQPAKEKTSSDTVTILCASRLSRRKGFRYVIEAFAQLVSKYPHLRLILAGGDGNATEELHEQVQKLKLQEKVTFTGEYTTREELQLLQQNADMFVFPSFNEGMSNNMLEAMAGGLPIIMTPTGGAEELIENGKNGFLVQFGNSKDIAQKIEKLLLESKVRTSMGHESRLKAESMSWKNAAAQYAEIYSTVSKK